MTYDQIREYYERVISHYEATEYYSKFPLNKFWGDENLSAMRSIIREAQSPLDVIHGAHRTFMFSVNVSSTVKENAVDWLLDEQRARKIDLFSLPQKVQESRYSLPESNVMRQGRILTPDFLRTVSIASEIDRYVRSHKTKLTVVELGAGMGHLARTLRLSGLTRSHIIIDLPETLVFSFCFLRENFPQARLLLVSGQDSTPKRLADYDFVFVPALFAETVLGNSYDLFINTASLGEMRNEVIRYWMDFIQNRLRVRHLFTLNRYLNTIDPEQHAWRWSENECSVHYDRRWRIRKWQVEPPFTRSPYVDTLIARCVEIIAERLEEIDQVECMGHSRNLLDEVKRRDWYRVGDQNSPVMTMRDNILVHDTTMTGDLFKLWDALRLNTTAEAVALLLQYLDTMLRKENREFEELKYYEDLFITLYDPDQDTHLRGFAEGLTSRRQKRRIRIDGLRLVASSDQYNFVQVNNAYFLAVARSLGPTELFSERLGKRELPPLLFAGQSLDEVRGKAGAAENASANLLDAVKQTVADHEEQLARVQDFQAPHEAKVADVETALTEVGSRIAALEEHLVGSTQKLKESEEKLTTTEQRVAELERASAEHRASTLSLDRDLAGRASAIEHLEHALGRAAVTLDELARELQNLRSAHEHLQESVVERHEKIRALEDALRRNEQNVETLATLVDGERRAASTLQARLADREVRLESLKTELSEAAIELELRSLGVGRARKGQTVVMPIDDPALD